VSNRSMPVDLSRSSRAHGPRRFVGPASQSCTATASPFRQNRKHVEAQTRRLKKSLPADVQQTIDEHQAAGTAHTRHRRGHRGVRHTVDMPARPSLAAPRHALHERSQRGRVRSHAMAVRVQRDGNLKDWEVAGRLGSSACPCSSRRDDRDSGQVLGCRHPRREVVVFDNSAHFAPVEEPNRYRNVLAAFLGRVQAAPA
jgi:pimeloyl-ACP methyl ester carboxylesterase